MHNSRTERTVLEIGQPLTQAFAQLSPYASRIRASWSKMMACYGPCGKHLSLLVGLHLSQRIRVLDTADPRAYMEESVRQGQELARHGVPAECAAVAVALYVECCLAYLMIDNAQAIKCRKAVIRRASI